MKLSFLLTILTLPLTCTAQDFREELLLGTWFLTEQSDGIDGFDGLLITGEESDNELEQIILHFQDDHKLTYTQLGFEEDSTFEKKDSLLTLGVRRFVIRKLDSSSLHLEDDSEIFPTTYYYKRIKN